MGEIRYPEKVKLIAGLITKDVYTYEKAKVILARHFGKIDFESGSFAFNYTRYYNEEMGNGLKRNFLSFKNLINPEKIAKIKLLTNSIEKKLSLSGKRRINIDPGYINLAKLVLATTKDYKHRIYLQNGIWAELTLSFSGNSFKKCECTYPDYCSQEYINTFNHIRGLYQKQIQ